MNEMDSLEQEMREWKPRKPPERLARRLFGREEGWNQDRAAGPPLQAPAALRRAEFWNWLTPVAACALTVLLAVGSANHRGEALEDKDGPSLFAGLNSDAGPPNVPRMARLSQMDENVQWNVCPELAPPAGTWGSSALAEDRRAAGTNLNRN